MTVYLKDIRFIDWETLKIKNTHLSVAPGEGGSIEFLSDLPGKDNLGAEDKIIPCEGKLVTKSFGCGHHHIYSTLSRGMPAPGKTPRNFSQVLEYIWWNLDKNLDLEMIRASALAAALFCAKNGVTFVIDHHASPFSVESSLSTIQSAFEKIGISHLLCFEISDRVGKEIREAGLEETANYLKQGSQGHVGLHASFTVGSELLTKAAELAKKTNTGIHIHVAEDPVDQDDCMKKYKKRVIQRLNDAGVLDMPQTILSHCLHLDEEEKKILRDSKAWVAENIESNLNNNVGLTNYSEYGDRIMLGTDGMHSDMLRSAKAAFFVGQTTEGISFPGIYQRFRNIHRYIRQNGFKGDGENNLVILDYNSPTEVHEDNLLGHFVFGIESSHVQSVIANGKVIVRDRVLQTADEDEILSFSREMGKRLWAKL